MKKQIFLILIVVAVLSLFNFTVFAEGEDAEESNDQYDEMFTSLLDSTTGL